MATPASHTSQRESPASIGAGYDSLLIVAFGGPEGPDDVMPFLENVTRGRNIPRERLEEVAEHYHHFGGKSPINDQVRELIAALEPELAARGIALPLHWGNRNWHPMLADTLRELTESGRKRTLAIVLAAYSSYSSCRQYRENIEAARQAAGPTAPAVDKLRVYYNHPSFIAANADRLRDALTSMAPSESPMVHVAFTAHSIPLSMAGGCDYERQLAETARLTAESAGVAPDRWKLVYQSRSGRPQDPWLEPDILDHLDALHSQGVSNVVIAPIGFLSDHMEVIYDLDFEARHKADALGMNLARAATVGTHPQFVAMLADLVLERVTGSPVRRAIGRFQANHDVCPLDCCPAPALPRAAGATGASPIRSAEPR
jgi:ferrochelatase